MDRFQYYESLKTKAQQLREEFGLSGSRVLRTDLRKICKAYGVKIDLWPYKLRRVMGLYMRDDLGATIMIHKGLPPEPTIFTMAHEFKHHLCDEPTTCTEFGQDSQIEIGAEVFAAELIFPDILFAEIMQTMKISKGQCTSNDLVQLKWETKTTLSYTGLAKKACFLGYGSRADFLGVRWKRLEHDMYGVPFYLRMG